MLRLLWSGHGLEQVCLHVMPTLLGSRLVGVGRPHPRAGQAQDQRTEREECDDCDGYEPRLEHVRAATQRVAVMAEPASNPLPLRRGCCHTVHPIAGTSCSIATVRMDCLSPATGAPHLHEAKHLGLRTTTRAPDQTRVIGVTVRDGW